MSSAVHITECGVPGIKSIPYGVHLCHFYDSRQDLIQALVPFFEAGLRNNERCIWVTADPLRTTEAALRKILPDLDAIIDQDRLRVLDSSDWYTTGDSRLKRKGKDVASAWLEEERWALAAGHAGLRISGNTSFLAAGDWDDFMEYEHAASAAFQGRRIVTLCSYGGQRSDAIKTLDVVRSHHSTLYRTDSSWQVLTSRERQPISDPAPTLRPARAACSLRA
jgi:two-component system, sensor histidine kinase PdtaS